MELIELASQIKHWGRELGFQQVGITDTDLTLAEQRLDAWLAEGHQASMDWMAAHGRKRSRTADLEPGTLRVISLRMDYLPADTETMAVLRDPSKAYISRYALGRDYHKLIRKRLGKLAEQIRHAVKDSELARAFVDSAPVMEKPLAEAAGLGWQGKHTNLVSRRLGSWFFLGAILTTLEFAPDARHDDRCGDCRRCLDICPTKAFPAPYQLDARRCISYLTIEHKGPIALEFRKPMGNRIYGCDDCLAVCPWNKFAQSAREAAFVARDDLRAPLLAELARLDDAGFRTRFTGSPVKRIGRDRFIRNVLIAIGNTGDAALAAIVRPLLADASPLVRGMAVWALAELGADEELRQGAAAALERESDEDVRAEWRRVSG